MPKENNGTKCPSQDMSSKNRSFFIQINLQIEKLEMFWMEEW